MHKFVLCLSLSWNALSDTGSCTFPGAGLWAVLTGMVDALPVFGTGTIFVPWLILVFCQKDYTFFVWLLLLYGITWLTRELLEPKLLGDGLGLLPVCFLISVIVGLKLFGAAGLFTGPFGILFVKELWTELEMWDSLQTPSDFRCGDEKDNPYTHTDKAVHLLLHIWNLHR